METFLKYFFPISVLVFFSIMIAIFFYVQSQTPQEVKDIVGRFTIAQKNLDFKTLKKLYASNATINFDYMAPDGTITKNFETKAQHVLSLAQKTRAIKKQINDYNEYSDIKYDRIEDNISVSSIRYSYKTKQKTPHILILSQDRKKNWWIMEEYIVEYVAPPKEN